MVINILGTRGFFRVRREFSVLAERHIFGNRPKPRAATQKPETALEKSLAPRVGDLRHAQSLHTGRGHYCIHHITENLFAKHKCFFVKFFGLIVFFHSTVH